MIIKNDGPDIIETDYWQTPHAERGYVYLSTNAGCFRLLVPTGKGIPLEDMKTSLVLITRGPWPEMGRHDAIEILFEDGSASPFCFHLVTEQLDRIPPDSDRDRKGQPPKWRFAIYTERDGKIWEAAARYRKAKRLPYLKPWNA